MRTMFILLTAVAGLLSSRLVAQPSEDTAKAKMEIFKAWEGHWQGEGKMQMGPGAPSISKVDEQVAYKLDGAILTVEGIGKATDPKTQKEITVHHAYGIVSYDQMKNEYQFNSFLKDGRASKSWFKPVGENSFQWGFEIPNGGHTRYSIEIDPKKNKWSEVGEYSRDGTTWNKFFEMNLTRVQ